MPKEAIALLLGMPRKKMRDEDRSYDDDDIVDVARDVLDAIKDDDEEALALALKRAYLACQSDEDDEDGEGY
jgi:DNA-binding GntR family transcriptional regulator